MRIENYKLINKGAIIASFDVFFDKQGWGLKDFAVMETNGNRWIKHPNRSYKTPEGKTAYYHFTYFSEGRKADFDKQIEALLKPLLTQPDPTPPSYDDEEVPF